MDELTDRAASAAELEDRILPWSQVKVISGLSRTTVWRLQKTGDFPASVQVSRNRVGWWQSELLEWKRSRTPRRLPEPRVVRPAPTPAKAPEPPISRQTREPLRNPGPRRRKADTAPGQGAFDF